MTGAEAEAVVAELVRRGNATAAAEAARVRDWSPHSPTPQQRRFLELDCLEALYGGAAGGGKSDALLMAALQHVDKPGYAALLLRRSYEDLALPGAIMDRAESWLIDTPARPIDGGKSWVFPSGATLTFGYLQTEKDKYRYKSAEFQFIGFDELTQFSETQYRYLFTRLRRPTSGPASEIPLRMRAATNPGDVGHDWVLRRFRPETSVGGQPVTHESRVFVPAKLDDNPHVDRESYEQALDELDETTRRQYRDGTWVRDGAGLIYPYDPDVTLVPELPSRSDWQLIWIVDFGSSESSPTTAIGVIAFSLSHPHVYLAESEKLAGMHPSEVARRFREDEERWREYQRQRGNAGWRGFSEVLGDQGGLGAGYIRELQVRHAIPMQPVEKKNKLGYRKLLRDDLAQGRLLVVEPHNDAWLEEAGSLTWNEKGNDASKGQPDHATDMALYGWRAAKHWLAQEPDDEPAPGSPEAAAREAARLKASRAARIRSDKQTPWWAKGRRR